MAQIEVFLVDPSALFRQGLMQLLPSEFHVIGQARDYLEAVGLLQHSVAPALILLDCPTEALREAVIRLKLAAPATDIVCLSGDADLDRIRSALEAGAAGYLTKDRTPEALVEQLRLIMLGEKLYPADLMQELLASQFRRRVELERHISPREAQILRCLVRGSSNKEIAAKLGIMDVTVKVHLKLLMRKLQVSNRTQAAIWARSHGFGDTAAAGATAAVPQQRGRSVR